jgi:hypothetical protein
MEKKKLKDNTFKIFLLNNFKEITLIPITKKKYKAQNITQILK